MQMVEFSEDFSKQYNGVVALSQKAFYRLAVRKGDIPYFNGGLDVQEFAYGNNLSVAVKAVLSDFDADVSVSGDHVLVGDISITLPEGLL